ncbi:pyridoxine 5'-phosphate synthase [Marinimicrobium sp. ABcell2]|uniref:pyridoxine 5'-phosphate synthase n=1 Tax=Marinimicrobium sp. ABcell2 TaxID=3069751 RepID=UPI0027AF4E95|nr:pyridoxine 5'-phosphate synthase [Marinimicrobium sp. ABcell2]MDQ2075550.1 pyridoxine 5'-phosphate synthase [Marinimicrobium sp. ABcell2]
MIPTKLSVNLNKIALIRNSREGNYPDLIAHGRTCLEAGADGLTVHPRPDQRHIRAADIPDLTTLLSHWPEAEFNIEGNPFAPSLGTYPGFMALVAEHPPHQCTLVPDSNDQLTSDHGFDLTQAGQRLTPIIRQIKDLGVRVSLFMDPDVDQIERASDLGADRIELYTGPYALAHRHAHSDLAQLLERYRTAAERARELGLGVNAGHDLNLDNLAQFLRVVGAAEVSIGHALTVDALAMGLTPAVAAYRQICQTPIR